MPLYPTFSRPFSLLLRHRRHHHHRRRNNHHRLFSSIPLSHPIYTIWAANTGLGKTLVSAGLASSVLLSPSPSTTTTTAAANSAEFVYIKPVQTGFPSDSDARFVFTKVSDIFRRRRVAGTTLVSSNHTVRVSDAAAREVVGWYKERKAEGKGNCEGFRRLRCKTLCAWREAVSPHLAVERESGGVEDVELLRMVERCFATASDGDKKGELWSVIETAGGVASPGPSGTLQCDLYR